MSERIQKFINEQKDCIKELQKEAIDTMLSLTVTLKNDVEYLRDKLVKSNVEVHDIRIATTIGTSQ